MKPVALALVFLFVSALDVGCHRPLAYQCAEACHHVKEIGCPTPEDTCTRICTGVATNDARFVACVQAAKTCDEVNACDGG